MRRPWLVIVLTLAACQPQSSTHGTASPTGTGQHPALIYVANGADMVEMDWSGNVVGSVSAQGFAAPSADGSRFLRYTDHLMVDDSFGHALGPLAEDPAAYGVALWADDGRHVCGIALPTNAGPDSGEGSLWNGCGVAELYRLHDIDFEWDESRPMKTSATASASFSIRQRT